MSEEVSRWRLTHVSPVGWRNIRCVQPHVGAYVEALWVPHRECVNASTGAVKELQWIECVALSCGGVVEANGHIGEFL